MKQATIQTMEIYHELGKEKALQWFSYTEKKFISHIDTFYYSVKTKGDWSLEPSARKLVLDLKMAKDVAEQQKDDQPFMEDDVFGDLVVRPFFGFRMDKYGLSKEGCFDIFIADSVPNDMTNAIVVQLRSEYSGILDRYGIGISDINENRINFAYHTNH